MLTNDVISFKQMGPDLFIGDMSKDEHLESVSKFEIAQLRVRKGQSVWGF